MTLVWHIKVWQELMKASVVIKHTHEWGKGWKALSEEWFRSNTEQEDYI